MKLSLKIYIFALAMMAVIMPAKGQNEQVTTLLPNGKLTLRYPVMKEDKLNFDLYVHKRKLTKALQIGTITGAGYLAGSIINQPKPAFDQARPQRNIPLKVSLFSSLAALNLFPAKKTSGLIIQVDEYSAGNQLIRSRYLPASKRRGNFHYTLANHASLDGYLVITMTNMGKKQLRISYNDLQRPKLYHENSNTAVARINSEAPIAGEDNGGWGVTVDGGTWGAVTITGSNDNTFHYYSTNASVLNENWTLGTGPAPVNGNTPGSGGNPGGGDPTGEPAPEVKELRRQFNDLGANRCEVRYVVDHLMDVPNMAAALLINRRAVTQNMELNGMPAANTNGSSPENAYKHALLIALNYCDFGEQHAHAMGSLHEECDGVNQNPTLAEKTMDLYNNSKGLQIAKGPNMCADKGQLANAVLAAYNSGVLHDVNGNPTP